MCHIAAAPKQGYVGTLIFADVRQGDMKPIKPKEKVFIKRAIPKYVSQRIA